MSWNDQALNRLTDFKLAVVDGIRVNFGSGASVARVGSWLAVFLLGSLMLASAVEGNHERRLAEAARALETETENAVQAFTFSTLPESELLAPEVPRIGIVGASESAGYLRRGSMTDSTAAQLAAELEKMGYPALLLDFATPGLDAPGARKQIQEAVNCRADVIVFTSALTNARILFGGSRMMVHGSERNQSGGSIATFHDPRGWTEAPTAHIDRLLSQWVAGYDTGFRHTFGLLAGTTDETAVFASGMLSDATSESVRKIPIALDGHGTDRDFIDAMRMSPPEEPFERLRLMVTPALNAAVPVMYVITPIARNHEIGFYELLNYSQFESELRRWDDDLNAPELGLHYWPAYKDDWQDSVTFYDSFHMEDSSAFIAKLAEVLVQSGLLAEFGPDVDRKPASSTRHDSGDPPPIP